MKGLKNYFIVLVVLFTSSCEFEKEIDYKNLTNYVPKIIVHGTINLQDGVEILVKKTTSPSKINENDILSNPVVYLHSETDSIALKRKGDYLFVLDSVSYLKPNQQYLLKVRADNIESIYSNKQVVLPSPVIDSIQLIDSYPKRLLLHFNNEDERTYNLRLWPYLNGSLDTLYRKKGFHVSDNIKKSINVVEKNLDSYTRADSIRVDLHLLSNDLVQFAKSVQDYEGAAGDLFYPQPFVVYTNIVGGYGVFGANSYTSVVIKINQ